MFCTSKKVFFSNHIIKHVRLKIFYHRSSFSAKGSIRTCICGIKYHSPLGMRMNNNENKKNHFLAQDRTTKFSNYSTERIDHDNLEVNVVGQTENDFRNAVVKEIEESLKNELSDLEIIEILEIAILANVKHPDLEFLNCYYNLLHKIDKNSFFYDKYFQHYCQLTSGSLETVNTFELKKKFELLNRRKSQKKIKNTNKSLKYAVVKESNEIENDFKLENVVNIKMNKGTTTSFFKAPAQSTVSDVITVIKELEYALSCNSISKEDIVAILEKACGCYINPDNIDSKFFDAFYRLLHKLKDLDEFAFNYFRNKFFEMVTNKMNWKMTRASYFIPFMTTYGEYVKLKRDEIKKEVWDSFLYKTRRSEGSDLTVEDRFSLLKMIIEVGFYSKTYLEFLHNIMMENIQNKTEDNENNSAVTTNNKFFYLRVAAEMRFGDLSFVEHVRELVIENPRLLEESAENLYGFLEALALTDFQNERKNYWPHLRRLIAELPVLQDVKKWEEIELFYHLHVVKLLLLWGICPKPLLTLLSERCNGSQLDEIMTLSPSQFCYFFDVLMSVNQVVYALHPSFNKPFLNANTLSVLTNRFKQNEIFERVKTFTVSLKWVLNREINNKHCVLINCFTKQGVRIDFAVALNETNKVFRFPKEIANLAENFIEDIILPDGYQWILLFVLREKFLEVAYNDHKLIDSRIQLNLKSMQAMGFLTIAIAREQWNDIHQKAAPKIWKLIRDKNSSRLLESDIGNIKEPILFD